MTGLAPGTQFVRTEQNFQGGALITLRETVLHEPTKPAKKSDIKGIWRYHFKTEFGTDTGLPATYVEWYDDASGMFTGHQKRSIDERDIEESIVRIIHAFYNNGTVEVRHEPVFKDEVRMKPLNDVAMIEG
jgi:hypothetical protein